MPARVTRTGHKLGYREVVYNVKKGKFYTDKDGDAFEQITIPGVTDSVTQEDIDNAVADKVTQQDIDDTLAAADTTTQAELEAYAATQTDIDAAVADKVTQTEIDTAVADKVTQTDIDDSITAAAATIVPDAIGNSQGYFFQNSHYFSDGLNHDTNPDVVEDVEAGAETVLKFSDTTTGESGAYLQDSLEDTVVTNITHMYDRSTGVITLKNLQAAQFIIIRVQVDLAPDSDNSSANICLRCTANGASGAFSFDIEEQLASLDQGVDQDYPAQITLPIFIGSTLSEDPVGSPATITPIVKFTNTSGDIKPRALAIFFWS